MIAEEETEREPFQLDDSNKVLSLIYGNQIPKIIYDLAQKRVIRLLLTTEVERRWRLIGCGAFLPRLVAFGVRECLFCLITHVQLIGSFMKGAVWIQQSGRKWRSGKCHFPLPLFIQTSEMKNGKTLFSFLLFLLYNYFLIFKVLQLILWSCKSHL